MLSILRRARRTNASATSLTMRSALLLPLVLALSLVGSAAQAEVVGTAATDEVAAIVSAQPEGTLAAPAEPLGRKELPEATSSLAPEAAITCNGAGGLWSAAGSWTGGIPTNADSVTIGSGCTITIDTAATALTIVVQSGGVLEYDATVAQTLTVVQSVTVDAGGIFRTPATGTITAHVLSVGTDLTNNGTLDLSTNANTAGAGITFTGAGNATFGGSGATTNIRTLTINKGTSFANTLELSTSNFTVQGTTTDGTPMAFLTLTNGTLKVSGSFTLAGRFFTAAGYTIPATGGFWLNNPNVTVSGQTGSPTNNGLFRLSSGTFNVGTASGNSMGAGAGSFFTIEGGTMNVFGRLNSTSANITFRLSGGVININLAGNAASTPSFGFTAGTTVSFFSGGTINLVQACTGGTPVDYNMGGTMNFTGGTLNVGTAATVTGLTFRVQGQMPNVVIDNTTLSKQVALTGQGNVWGNLTINPGTSINVNPGSAQTLVMIGPSLINNGAIGTSTNNTGTVNFAGGLQQLGAPYAQTYSGTGTLGAGNRVGSFSVQSPLGVTLDPAVSNLNVYRINDFYGPITNASKLAIGNADAVAAIIQRGVGGNPFAAGSLDVAPTFNVGGAGGLTLVYAQATSATTTGPEIPVTRTVLSFQIANSTGVTLAGGALTCTGATNCLALGGGTLTTDSTNLFTISNTAAGSLAGGSALTYVNGPLARTLPASLAAGATYTFPVGKSAFKMLEVMTPTTTAGGSVVIQTEVFDANSGGTAGTGFSSINTNRYWSAAITSGAANFTSAAIRL
nr:hypothetical protein [Lacunisphaera sp.]